MNDQEKKKRGGQPKSNPANSILGPIRVTPLQLDEYKSVAKSKGITLSEWVRTTLDKAAKSRRESR